MAKTYKVKQGDTVSEIAEKFGVSKDKVSGYRSGDENRISPGEELTIEEGEQSSIEDIRSKAASLSQKLEEQAKNMGREDVAKNISDIRGRITAGDLGDSGDTNLPDIDSVKRRKEGAEEQIRSSVADIEGTIASASESREKFWEARNEMAQQTAGDLEETRQQREQIFEDYQTFREDRPSARETREEELEKYEIDEKMEQMDTYVKQADSIRGQIRDVEAEMAEKVGEAESQGMPEVYIRGEKSRIQRQYDSKIASLSAKAKDKLATAEYLKGNIQMGRNIANRAVEDMTWDYEQRAQDYRDYMDFYSQEISELSDEQQNYLTNLQSYWETEAELKREELKNIMDYKQTALEEYGVVLDWSTEEMENMTTEEAQEKYMQEVQNQTGETVSTEEGAVQTEDGTTYDLTNMQELAQFKEDGGTKAQAQKNLDLVEGYTQSTIDEMLKEVGFETDEEPTLSDTQINKMAVEGVPTDYARTIMKDRQNGHSFDDIYEGIKQSTNDPVKAGKYIDVVRNTMAQSGQLQMQTDIERGDKYEQRGKTEKAELEGEGEEESETKWFNPLTWF
ncbi:MAG: LysM peptidoglycan-binding domain-containing protein [Elusimicrobiota bacterium]